MPASLDPAVVRILVNAYWSPSGRRDRAAMSDEVRAALARAGLPVEVRAWTHDEVLANLIPLRARVPLDRASAAFVASLSSRRLELRSLLSSTIVARHFAEHAFVQGDAGCAICGVYEASPVLDDPCDLVFEKVKWGGVRLTDPRYVALDLRTFADLWAEPMDEDRARLLSVLHLLDAAPPKFTPAKVEPLLKEFIPGNKSERSNLLDMLGIVGVLETQQHRGFLDAFQPVDSRAYPPWHYCDWGYPVRWWRGADGVNWANARRVFGEWVQR